MKGIADLHIHSRYSRATSKQGTPEYLDLWARKKGISILGTGDFTHPQWREELKEKLIPAEDGLYCLKKEAVLEESGEYKNSSPRFVLSGEISSIYKKNGKVRKVHNVILLPSLEDAEKLSKKLETIGNIHSDGRPILGLDSHDLLEIMLELCPRGILIPAHIWTPHFSMFGAFSGFDTVEECFEDLTPYIHAVETGLSSDPLMNGKLSALDRLQLISNSDAHSPAKLGREANLLDIDLSYQGLYQAIQEGNGLEGTIEFFPEEGKYHFDGHRKCHLCLSPEESEAYGGICPICGKKITIGVDHRVLQLSDRKDGKERKNKKPFEYLVPLPEVIAASTGKTPASKKVQEQYETMLHKLGPEFEILREVPVEVIRKEAGYMVAEGIRRLRAGQVKRTPGFDGEYGVIRLFEQNEIETPNGQMSFFSEEEMYHEEKNRKDGIPSGQCPDQNEKQQEEDKENEIKEALNEKQRIAAEIIDRRIAVAAGPGTGKTKTLIARILYLLEQRNVGPGEITAVTFTNQAARELKERLMLQAGSRRNISRMHIGTFHSICLDFLKKQGRKIFLADTSVLTEIAKELCGEYGLSFTPAQLLNKISLAKTRAVSGQEELLPQLLQSYQERLHSQGLYDFDDLLTETIKICRESHESRKKQTWERGFSYLMVDEFQDISPIQYELILEWNKNGKELFVIGDQDQSIYSFRGSDSRCFTKMMEEYPETRLISLENNYRSTGHILDSALAVISNNPGMERKLKPWKEKGIPVRIVEASSKNAEAVFAAKEINRLVGGMDMLEAQDYFAQKGKAGQRSFRDIAVLYRTHHQARLLEKCLQKEGIPYIVRGREGFLENPLVQGTISFFCSLSEPEHPAYREEAVKKLWNLEDSQISSGIYEEMAVRYEKKWKRTKPKKLIQQWAEDLNLAEDKNLQMLADMTIFYNSTQEFLDAVRLGEEGDLKRCGGKSYHGDAVSLMTLHASKGLEFPVVILFGMEKGEVPLEREENPADVEEERRLFYVGMTRAREELILTFAEEPSAFLEEIPEEDAEREKTGKQKNMETCEQLSLFDFIQEKTT